MGKSRSNRRAPVANAQRQRPPPAQRVRLPPPRTQLLTSYGLTSYGRPIRRTADAQRGNDPQPRPAVHGGRQHPNRADREARRPFCPPRVARLEAEPSLSEQRAETDPKCVAVFEGRD